MDWIYLDNNATTKPDPAAVAAMQPFLSAQYANPSSLHHFGQQARHAVETGREQIATCLHTRARNIIFTGGGTEANDLAIRGTLAARTDKKHFVTSTVEHDSIRRLAEQLAREGYRVTHVGVDEEGRLDLNGLETALDDDVALVSIMHANNETGVIFPLDEVGACCAKRGIPLHTDATQTIGKMPVDLSACPAQLVTFAGHKFHGPKGAGGLHIKRGTRLRARMRGGRQERELRPGTENVAAIVGTAEALKRAVAQLETEDTLVRALRDRFEQGVVNRVGSARILGQAGPRLPNTTMIAFATLEAEAILMLLSDRGICASSGSACSSGALEPSHVVQAMGIAEEWAHGTIRFSLSRFTTDDEIDRALTIIPEVIERLQQLQPSAADPPR